MQPTTLTHAPIGPVDGRGRAQCLGLAYASAAREATIYLNLVGPPTAVAAVRSLMSSGAAVSVRYRRLPHPLRSRDLVKRGPVRIPHLQWDHLLLLDPRFTYDEDHDWLFLFAGPHLEARAADAIRRTVRVPVLPPWVERLPAIARRARLLVPATAIGDSHPVWALRLHRPHLEDAICEAVAAGSLPWPTADAH